MTKILLVDDDENLRPALQKTLESLGHQVITAADGKAAFDLFKRSTVDLIISDIRMPEMDGLALTRMVKDMRPVPIILITGFAEILETHEAHQLGADEFLAKPFERKELIDAIQRCIHRVEHAASNDDNYCRLALEDFTSGRQIQYSIYVRLSECKYIKIAHQGEDLTVFRIKAYKQKNVHYLYLTKDDFRKYVGFNLTLTMAARNSNSVSKEQRLTLMRHTSHILLEQIQESGMDHEMFDSSKTFVETVVDTIMEDENVFTLLKSLNEHVDYLYSHSLGVSLYGVLLARAIDWKLPNNTFKIALAGILHEIGMREMDRELLMRPRASWSLDEVRIYESHPTRGVDILSQIRCVPADVLEIVKQHHENVKGHGFPARLRKAGIHPMAKLVAVADEFCDRVIQGPNGPPVSPLDAIAQMRSLCSDKLEPQFMDALARIFAPPAAGQA